MRSGINLDQVLKNKSKNQLKPDNGQSLTEVLYKDFELFSQSFGDKRKEKFYSDLSILSSSGLDIKATLELIEGEETKTDIRLLISGIKDDLVEGLSLSDAIAKTEKFTKYEIFSIKIGEESGKLQAVLSDLAAYYAKKIKQKRQLTGALSYPAVVLTTVTGVLIFMMKFMVPMFADVFKRFKGDLPPITKFVISASNFIGNSFYLFIVAIIICSLLFYSKRKEVWLRKMASEVVLKIPIIGSLVQKIYLGRFCHSMSLLLSAQIPLVNALEMVEKMIGFYPIEGSIASLNNDITKGKTFWESLKKHPIYSNRMISLVKVGEEVNELNAMFENLNNQYNDEVEHQTTVLKTLLEPILILFLGLVVGFIMVAIYLPIFQMSTGIGN